MFKVEREPLLAGNGSLFVIDNKAGKSVYDNRVGLAALSPAALCL